MSGVSCSFNSDTVSADSFSYALVNGSLPTPDSPEPPVSALPRPPPPGIILPAAPISFANVVAIAPLAPVATPPNTEPSAPGCLNMFFTAPIVE